MAKDLQHYVPRFLLRGFLSDRSNGKNKERTWVYKKNKVYPASINDVFCEDKFYDIGESGGTADDAVSRAESLIAPVIASLRSGIIEETVRKSLPVMLAHLSIRTKHVRSTFSSGLESVHKAVEAGSYLDSKEFEMAIIDELKRQKYGKTKIRILLQQIKKIPREKIKTVFDLSFNSAKAVINQRHSEVLRNQPVPQCRVDQFSRLKYAVVDCGSLDLILGDCVIVNWSSNVGYYGILSDNDLGFERVFLPLNTHLLLVGFCGEVPNVNLSELIKAVSVCSSELFVSSVNSECNKELSKGIGESAMPFSDRFFHDIVFGRGNENTTS